MVAHLTSFIGRTHELTEITALLADPACRLLTLIGPGGIGKTRLVAEVAKMVVGDVGIMPHGGSLRSHHAPTNDLPRREFSEGIHFVPLQPVSDATLLPIAIANALGIPFFGAEEPRLQLLNYLREKNMLLILDNFEHLLDGVDFVIDMLESRGVKILITSRTALNIQAEWRYAVGGLNIPANGDAIENFDAVRLFSERARRLRHDFSPTDHHADVVRICQLTEGMPLALELAAGWLKVLSCAEIANEIQRGLDFLAVDARDVPERHRSMAAAFARSWELLTDHQQAVFRKMSVFRGGFTREAAASVSGATLHTLAALVDKSFLKIDPTGRYDIHELLRQYGETKLAAAGEVEAIRDAHCNYFAGFMHQREELLKSHDQLRALNEIEAEFENIRLMWRYAVAQKKPDPVNQAVESLYLFNLLRRPHQDHHLLFGEARERFAPRAGEAPTSTWGRIVVREYLGPSSLHTLDQPQALARVKSAVQIARQEGNTAEVACSLHHYGYLTWSKDALEAIRWYQESLSHYESMGEIFHRAQVLQDLAFAYANTRQMQQALTCYHKGLEISRPHRIHSATAQYLSNLGANIALGEGNYTLGISNLEESVQIYRDLASPGQTARSARWLSVLYFVQGDFDRARMMAEEARDNAINLGQFELLGLTQSILGMLANTQGDYPAAMDYCQQGLQNSVYKPILTFAHWALGCTWCGLGDMHQAHSHLRTALLTADGLPIYPACTLHFLPIAAFIHHHNGNPGRAVELLGLTFSHPKAATGWLEKWPLLIDLQAELEGELGAKAYSVSWERGKQLNLEAVIGDILAEFSQPPTSPNDTSPDSLTEREREVLQLIAAGLSNAQIAERLVISIGTVKSHMHNIYGKLGVETRAQAIVRIRDLRLTESKQ